MVGRIGSKLARSPSSTTTYSYSSSSDDDDDSSSAERTAAASSSPSATNTGFSPSPSSAERKTRRAVLADVAASAAVAAIGVVVPPPLPPPMSTPVPPANAAVGSLPEFDDANAVLQGLTVRVADQSQQDSMIAFMTEGFGCRVLRERVRGSVHETWLGYGPERMSVPSEFRIGVSSFDEYGGHASVHLVYDSQSKSVLYNAGVDPDPPGDNVAYLQLGVPSYRISAMVKNGGAVLDAYGLISVVSPAGLPIRGVVGSVPDPIMYVALNCADVESSKAFYRQHGFVERANVPYARPSNGTTIFEPAPPSNAAYMSPSRNCMGVLLLPVVANNQRRRRRRQKTTVTPNPVVDSLNVVYTPSTTTTTSGVGGGDAEEVKRRQQPEADVDPVTDPSGVVITFTPYSKFEAEEKQTR